MCTGILANVNGSIYHARNFDQQTYLNKLQYEAQYTKNGTKLFQASNIFGFAGIFTGFKPGKFSIEMNTRFADAIGYNYDMLIHNLLKEKTKLICWENRKMLENFETYDEVLQNYETS